MNSMITPDFRRLREYIDSIPSKRDSVLIKLLYLTAGRVSEVTTKVTPYDLKYNLSKPYGRHLDYSIGDYGNEKVLLLKMAVAKRRIKRRNNQPYYKIIALPTHPRYEPWTLDLIKWLRDNRRLSFDLTRNRVYTIVRKWLSPLDPKVRTHSLRHWRITHLVTEYDFTPYEITAYAGWTFKTGFSQMGMNSGTLDAYLHLIWKQYFPKLLKPIQEMLRVGKYAVVAAN